MTNINNVSPVEYATRVETVRLLCWIIILVGALTFSFGIPTIILVIETSNPNPSFPFVSGSGVYGGLLTLLCGMFGLAFLKNTVKCLNVTFRVFLTIAIDCGALNFGYGIWSIVLCSRGPSDSQCGGDNWSANYLLAVINMVMGLLTTIITIVTYVLAYKILKVCWSRHKIRSTNQTDMTIDEAE